VIMGGALLLTPGFITDIFGLILLIPPTRAIVRGISSRIVRRRMAMGATIWTMGRGQRPPRQRPAGDGPEPGSPPPRGPASDDFFDWEEPVAPPRAGPRADDIEGTGHEIRDEDELPPGREPFGG
jgi:UPF0716 family protein affecting phage T7 exclusion